MAFNVDEFVKGQTQQTPGGFNVDEFIKKQTAKASGGFDTNALLASQGVVPKRLDSTSGLKARAQVAGLGDRAAKITEPREDQKEIFSGGVISDIFDGLNALQYGVAGVLKGKTFSEGVKTRQSFTDKDALGDKGIPGIIAGLAIDIAIDPLTYISPVSVFKKIPGAVKALDATSKAVGKTRAGDILGRAFIYRFGQDKVYKDIAERSMRNVSVGIENMVEIARPLTKLDPATQRVIAGARKAGTLSNLPAEILAKAKPAFDELDALGKQAVEAGLLKPEVYEKNVGTYMRRLYRTYEEPQSIAGKVKAFFSGKKPLRIDQEPFLKRKDLPEEVRQLYGEILEAGYPTAKGLVQLKSAVENAKFFREVATKFGSDIAGSGLEKLPKTWRLGDLGGKYVPKAIADDINEIVRSSSGFTKKAVAGFKFGKVILNPATHLRNIYSNFILNNFEGLSPARVDIYAEALKEMYKKGSLYKEAKAAGLGVDTFAARELKDFLTGPEGLRFGKSLKGAMDTIANAYEKEELFAKMAQFIYQKRLGKTAEEAARIAERATFNYAQVTPFIRRLRESAFGYPFITFTYKVTPQVAKTLAKKPTKISNIGKAKAAIENLSDKDELARERATEPQWVRDGFYVKLPIKDKNGRSAYLDLSYVLPFGDLVSGQFFERGINRETGLPESIPEAAMNRAPLLNFIGELSKNQDFYGNKIWRDSDSTEKQLGDLFRHVVKTYAPPLIGDQLPGGIQKDGTRRPPISQRVVESGTGEVNAGGFQERTAMQEFLRNIGIKVSPVDIEKQESLYDYQIQNALETLLTEHGAAKKFERVYIPKN